MAEQTGSRKGLLILVGVAIVIDVITFVLFVSETFALRTTLIIFIVESLIVVPLFIIAKNARRQ